jgi:hypothetical protein
MPAAFACAQEEDPTDGADSALESSPTEERAKTETLTMPAYLSAIEQAYVDAKTADFTPLKGEGGFVGEMSTDFATLSTNCTAARRFRITAYRWTVAVPGGTADATVRRRDLFVIDVFNEMTRRATLVGLYDTHGALLLGRRYSSYPEGYARQNPTAFRKYFTACSTE